MPKIGKNRWKVPKNIKVGKVDYKVQPCTKHYATREKMYGCIHYGDEKILFSEGLNKTDTADVLLHELLHAINNEYNIRYTSKRAQELVVNRLSTKLIHTLRDNPQLLEWLYNIIKTLPEEET